MDLGPRDAPDASDTALEDRPAEDAGPPPEPGSTEALLREVCAGRPRRGAPTRLAYSTAPENISGGVRDLRPGDLEAVHLVLEAPLRIERLRLRFRGGDGGRVRVKLTEDYGRSNPDPERDLTAPVEVTYRDAEPVELTLPQPVELHPARHAWVVVEHLTEPMGLAVAASRGGNYRSYFRSAALIERLRAMGGDSATFRWVQLAGMNMTVLEYAVEVEGEALCPRQGTLWFQEATMATGLQGTTHQTSAVDLDDDGWDDLVGARTGMDMTDTLQAWRNRRDGTFEDVSARTGLGRAQGRLGLFGDYDGDGDLDVYAGVYRDGRGPFTPEFPSRQWVQGPDGTFTEAPGSFEPAGPTAAGSLGDCDNDGNLDLFVGQWLRQYPMNPAPDFLFRGLGGGRFENGSVAAGLPGRPDGRPTYGVTFADYDNDGDRDVFVANYGGSLNDLWQNDGRCHFVNVGADTTVDADTRGRPGTSFGFALGDYDNDGDLDAYETNIAHPRYDQAGLFTDHPRLLRNTGAPDWRFEDVAEASGLLYNEGEISSAWGDYDNDGDLDLYVASTYPFQYSRLYRQEADHHFTDVTYLAGVATEFNGRALWLDYDRDGDLDLVTAPQGAWTVHRNDLRGGNHWLELRLSQPAGNTRALGARVTVRDSLGVERVREIDGGGATWGTQASPTVHVGLGATSGPVTVRVRWPGGERTEYPDVAPDARYRIVRGSPPQRME